MTREEIIDAILKSEIITEWHWFNYHFNIYKFGDEHPFAKSIVNALVDIGKMMPGVEMDLLRKLAAIHGVEKDLKHYELLMQVLAEILIIYQSVTFRWTDLEKFEYEPTVGGSKKNPELNIFAAKKIIGIEVKSPSLLDYQKNRQANPYQFISRNPFIDSLNRKEATLPRDNPVKDFLISADEKFESFKQYYDNYISFLYIVWDDFINEPISALLGDPQGLFMKESFAKDKQGDILKFVNVDYVMISRHRLQFQQMAAERPFPDFIRHPLDYGQKDVFPFKVIIKNPYTNVDLTKDVLECYQVLSPCPEMGAEYVPGDIVMWI